MKKGILAGIGFGLSSGVITTLGLMVGLASAEASRAIVASGVLTIALADALADSLGMHLAIESDTGSRGETWRATFSTFAAKLVTAATFLWPIYAFSLPTAIWVSTLWGMAVLTALSAAVARHRQESVSGTILQHLLIAVFVVATAHYFGQIIPTIIPK